MTGKSAVRAASVAAALCLALGGAACTSKNYVQQQVTPLTDHLNQLDANTAANTNALRSTQASTRQGLAAASQSAQNATDRANAAQQQAAQVTDNLNQTSGRVQALDSSMANLDSYTPKASLTVHFAFDKADLTPESQATLQQAVAQLRQDPHAIVEVKGYTDSTGPVDYNYALSQRRANAAVRYLETQGIAQHRIFLIGLGDNQAAAPNTTSAGRQENRRVDLTILDDGLAGGAAASIPR